LAVLFKRVRNIGVNRVEGAEGTEGGEGAEGSDLSILTEPAEVALLTEITARQPMIETAVKSGQGFRQAFAEAAKLGPTVAKFFDDVLVMAEDVKLRAARLRLMKRLETLILQLADVSEIVPEEGK
jgi:glycyl-tRNA synthetase beta chain